MSEGRRRRRRAGMLTGVVIALAVSAAAVALPGTGGSSGHAAPPPAAQAGPPAAPVFDERFDGSGLDVSRWNTCHWWDDGGCTIATNHEQQWYLPEQVAVADGTLRLTARRRHTVGADGTAYPYTSGMVTTGPPAEDRPAKFDFVYGTVEVRYRTPVGAGLWPAIWLLPSSERPVPEIDLMEAVGQLPHQVGMYFHPSDPAAAPSGRTVPVDADCGRSDWHTVRLVWAPGSLTYFLDDVQVWQVRGDTVPDEPMYLVLNLAVGGDFGGLPDPAAFPATFMIDRVRIEPGAPR